MSSVNVRVPHQKDPSEIREQIGSFEEMLSKYSVQIIWSGHQAELKNPAISGNIEIGADYIEVNIKLGMMAKAMGIKADKLTGSIRRRLEAALV
jgi:putative polyhydroxyalkanoate system protein